MAKNSTPSKGRKWHDSRYASLCLLGHYLCPGGFFHPLEEAVHIRQKVIKYTPAQKLRMLLVSLLAGAKAVSPSALTLRVDPAL